MGKIELLGDALTYMENHLEQEITTQDIARSCYCSRSTLEKLFRYANHMSVHDYLVRRRMMKAARLLHENPKQNILDIAMLCGYASNESFTRAFKQVWNCKPSEFRRQPRYSELFPRLLPGPLENGDTYMKERRRVDISELYDLFSTRKNCFFVCCDIKNLHPVNEISRKAGDMAILETLRRLGDAAGPQDVFFRIGGDEFALLTDREERDYAEQIARKLLSENGTDFEYEGRNFPLSLHVSIMKPEKKTIKYDELVTGLHTAIRDSKR